HRHAPQSLVERAPTTITKHRSPVYGASWARWGTGPRLRSPEEAVRESPATRDERRFRAQARVRVRGPPRGSPSLGGEAKAVTGVWGVRWRGHTAERAPSPRARASA